MAIPRSLLYNVARPGNFRISPERLGTYISLGFAAFFTAGLLHGVFFQLFYLLCPHYQRKLASRLLRYAS